MLALSLLAAVRIAAWAVPPYEHYRVIIASPARVAHIYKSARPWSHGEQLDPGPRTPEGGALRDLLACFACHAIHRWRYISVEAPPKALNALLAHLLGVATDCDGANCTASLGRAAARSCSSWGSVFTNY